MKMFEYVIGATGNVLDLKNIEYHVLETTGNAFDVKNIEYVRGYGECF